MSSRSGGTTWSARVSVYHSPDGFFDRLDDHIRRGRNKNFHHHAGGRCSEIFLQEHLEKASPERLLPTYCRTFFYHLQIASSFRPRLSRRHGGFGMVAIRRKSIHYYP